MVVNVSLSRKEPVNLDTQTDSRKSDAIMSIQAGLIPSIFSASHFQKKGYPQPPPSLIG